MKKIFVVLFAGLFLLGAMGLAIAGEKGSQGAKAEAKAMVEKAAVWVKTHGKDKILAEITRAGTEKKGAFIDRDLYLRLDRPAAESVPGEREGYASGPLIPR